MILFPTRFIGRGTTSTLIGAGLIVGMMMLIYFGLSATLSDTGGTLDQSALAGVSPADISALEKLF